MRRILALTRYGREAASTRQRFAQFGPALRSAGYDLAIEPFFDDRQTATINRGDALGFSGVARAYARRAQRLVNIGDVDLLWVQYEIFPFLPSAIETMAARRVPVVVDFDDAYYLRYDMSANPAIRAVLADKMRPLVSSAAAVVVGNKVLADHVGRWNAGVDLVPTVVDTNAYGPAPRRKDRPLTIGWIGSPSTWRAYVRPHVSLLRTICREQGVRILVIGAGDEGDQRVEEFDYRPWDEAREIDDIQEMDIGIMPLPDDPWARGKCGYKLIQYMACGVPTVASPVGVNVDLAAGGMTGLLAATPDEWASALSELIAKPALREAMGKAGRALATSTYSLEAQAPRLTRIFERVMARECRATG